MFKSIPASHIVNVNPAVLSAGGSPLSMNAVFLSKNTNLPTGQAVQFASATAVGEYFGLESDEYKAAKVYFSGFDNSTIKPSNLYFCAYNSAAEGAFLLGTSLKKLSLEELKAINGEVTLSIDGTEKKITNLDLSRVTSFSNAAEKLAQQMTPAQVQFDPQLQAFKIISSSTGSTSTITFAKGTAAEKLGLTKKAGATISAGSAQSTPEAVMKSVVESTLNWATFTTVFEATLDEKIGFANWSNAQNNRFMYVGWGMEVEATQSGNIECFGAKLKESNFDGSCAVYGGLDKAAFICGTVASIDFTERQGRITLAFKGQSGLTADVTDETIANILKENGYNFYGAWATANDRFLFLSPGQIAGKWDWIDAYINQIRINSQLQLALITLLTSVKSLPYNADGIALQRAACTDPINEAINFGSIQIGVVLSEQQKAIINREAGFDAASMIESRGYCLYIAQATAQTRGQRQSMPMKLWYTDGGSVQSINLASINIQ